MVHDEMAALDDRIVAEALALVRRRGKLRHASLRANERVVRRGLLVLALLDADQPHEAMLDLLGEAGALSERLFELREQA